MLFVWFAAAGHDLNGPWVKRHVQELVRSSSGLDIDYGSARLSVLTGVEIDDLVVQSPSELRALAPDFVRAGHVDVRWSPSSLLGHGPRVEQIDLADVALTVVVDEHGRTSFDAFGGPSVPLSHRPGQLLAPALPAARLDAPRVDLTMIWTQGGRVVERDLIRGVGVALAAEPGPDGSRVHAALGTADAPLDLDMTRERDGARVGAARARFWLSADMSTSVLNVASDLKVLAQDFVPSIEAGDWHAEASARFEPAAGRTIVAFDHVIGAAGSATAEGTLEVPDEGASIVRHAQGEVDVVRLLAWLPAGLVPFVAERASLTYRVDSASPFGELSFLESGRGAVHIDASVSNAKVRTSDIVMDVDRGRLVLDGRALTAGGIALRGSQQIDGATVELPRMRLDVGDVSIDVDGQRADGAMTGHLDVRFGRLRQEAAKATVIARDGRCQLRFERGDVAVSADIGSLDARLAADRVLADSVALEARSRLESHAPYGGDVAASATGLQVFAGDKRLVARAPARIAVHLQDVFPDADHPLATRGVVRAKVDLGQSRASLDAVKRADAIAYTLVATAPSLKAAVSPFAGAAGWDTMAIALRSNGRVDRIASTDPQVVEDTSLDVDRPAFRGVSARSLSLAVHSQGSLSHHEAVAKLRLLALAIDGAPPSDDTVALSAVLDRDPWSLRLQAGAEGRATTWLDVSASFDGKARAVVYDLDGWLSDLAPIAPLVARVPALRGFDLSRLELGLAARGALFGVVSSMAAGGAVELETDPWRTAAVEGTADVRVAKLRWARGDTALEVPAAVWHGNMRTDRTLDGHADIDSMRLRLGRHQIDLAGISDDATATLTGDLQNPMIALTQRAAIRAGEQDFVAEYPVGDVTIAVSARRDAEGDVRLEAMNLHNGRGGTTLAVEGGLDLGTRRRLSMTAHVAQDLEPLSAFPQRFTGHGKVELAGRVESPDLAVFRTRLDLKATGVGVRMPAAGVEADSVDGEIPITVAFDVSQGGIAISRDARGQGGGPFSRLGFADRHPLLRRTGFVSIGRMITPHLSIAPFVGNVAVEQNVVLVEQFEMGARGGWLTGECALDWDGLRSVLEAHVRASGVRSSNGEPFDGNIEVVVSASDRMIEGRADVRRMGKRHLEDLLDMEDPLHVDLAMNHVRNALALGGPKRLHVAFDNGFANAHIELGGLASLMHLDDVRGIPTGPLVDRLVGAVLDGKATP